MEVLAPIEIAAWPLLPHELLGLGLKGVENVYVQYIEEFDLYYLNIED